MTTVRIFRVLRNQWWVIILIAVLGASIALGAAELRNRALEPSFEGIAPLTVLRLPEEKDDRFNRRVATVLSQARSAVSDRLTDPSLRVEEGEAGGVVNFVATAPTSDGALESAVSLRRIYLDSRPTAAAEDQLNPILESLLAEIEVVERELAQLRGASADPMVEAQRSALLSELGSVAQESAALDARLLDPGLTDEERNEAEARLESLDALVGTITGHLEELPQADTSPSDVQTRMDIQVLEGRLRNLEAQYVSSALQQDETETEGLVGEPYAIDQSPTELSLSLAAIVGLLAGSLVSGVGVVATDRLRRPIRAAEDVSRLPVIEVDRRHRRSDRSVEWYLHAGNHSRRVQIQSLRSSLDRFPDKSRVIVTGTEEIGPEVQTLAEDLAVSIAVTGRKVLIIDTNFGSSATDEPDATLSDILLSQRGVSPDAILIKRLLDERHEVVPNLLVVPAGSILTDPIDALAGPAFKRIIGEASELADVVIVSAPPVGTPGGDAASVHSQLAIVGAARNRTHHDELYESIGHLEDVGIAVSAIALLTSSVLGSRRRGRRQGMRSQAPRSQRPRRARNG